MKVIFYSICITGMMLSLIAAGQDKTTTGPAPTKDAAKTQEQMQAQQRLVRKALTFRRDLAFRLEDSLVAGRDISSTLELYMKGRAMGKNQPIDQIQLYLTGMSELKRCAPQPLPQAVWPAAPQNVPLELKESFTVPAAVWQNMRITQLSSITFRVVAYTVGNLKQYAILTETNDKDMDRPLVIFAHGAAFGVPDYMLPWMARLAAAGYTVAAPAFRGEPLLARSMTDLPEVPKYICEGKIENLKGEVEDLLALATGLREKKWVRQGKYAIVGHSFGSGAGLLAATRTKDIACVVSYDAWMTNPFRFYWERLANEGQMNDKSYLWGSWDAFTKQPAKEQLHELMARSVVHHADRITAPLLLFTGGGYNGSAYHYTHKSFVKALRKHHKTVQYEIMPGGGHNFLLYSGVEPAVSANYLQMQWLTQYFPGKK